MSRTETERQIRLLWQSKYSAAELPYTGEKFSTLLDEFEGQALHASTTSFQPAMCLLELGLEWLSYVHVALSQNLPDKSTLGDECYRASWALTGAAVSFGVSLRKLCLTGHDTPAKALLRTFVETLLLCIATLHDHDIAKQYVESETDDEIKEFWHKIASPKKLHKKIIEIEKQSGLSPGDIESLVAWRREEYEVLSQASHLSFIAAALTAMPVSDEPRELHRPGLLGVSSPQSERTVTYAACVVWYFSRFCWRRLLGTTANDGIILFDPRCEWQQRIVIGRDVIAEAFEAYWDKLAPISNE